MSQLADNVVVIGKGKLIADMSMAKLISGSAHSSVFVRTGSLSKLQRLLKQQDVTFEDVDGGLKISGKSTDDIGRFAFEASIPILELTNHNASLEDAFLELTEGSEEFQTQPGKKGKKGSKA
jgi:ABC-2 type transport system ATP-binding protein